MLRGEVVELGAIDVGVVELPLVLVEMAPAGDGRVGGDGLPALVPDRPRAEHRVELGLPVRRRLRVVEAAAHADAVELALDVALDRPPGLEAEDVEDRRHDVDRVVVLIADLAARLRPLRPGDDARVRRPAIELVALPHLERRVERHRPAVRVVVVGPRAPEVVDLGQVLGRSSATPLANFISLTDPFGPTFAARSVVRDDDDHRVLELIGRLEVVEQAPDVMVGVGEEAGVDLGHPGEQALLVGVQRLPRTGRVEFRERQAIGSCPRLGRPDRVDRRELRVRGDDAQLLLPGQRLLAHGLVAHVELALELVAPLLRGVVRSVAGARARSTGRTACPARSPWRPG